MRAPRLVRHAAMTLAVAAFFTGPAAAQQGQPRPELVLQAGHGEGTLWQVALSANGALLASAGRGDNAVHVWDAATGRQLRLFDSPARGQQLNSGVSAIAFGNGGRLLAAGFTDGSVSWWDVSSGRELGRFVPQTAVATPFPEGVTGVWFDPTGARLYAAGDPQGVHLFDATTGREAARVAVSQPPQAWIAQTMTRDGSTIVAIDPGARNNESIVLQDAASGRAAKKRVPGALAHGRPVAVAADGRVLVASVSGDTIQISDATNGREVRSVKAPGGKVSEQSFVMVAPDGRLALASGSRLTVWGAQDAAPVFSKSLDVAATLPDAATITSVDVSEDGTRIAAGSFAGTAIVFDASSGRETARTRGDINVPYSVGFSADGARLYPGARTGWNFAAGRAERLIGGSTAILSAVSGDGRLIATATPNSSKVEIWDTVTRRETATLARNGDFDVGRVALSRDGRYAAVAYQWTRKQIEQASRRPISAAGEAGPPIAIWDLTTGKEVRTLTPAVGAGRSADTLQFNRDASRLVVTFRQQPGPVVFDVGNGKQVASLAPETTVGGVDPFARMAQMMGGGKMKPEAAKRAAEIIEQLRSLRQGPTREIGSAAYSPDGRFVAVAVHELGSAMLGGTGQGAGGGGAIEVWDVGAVKPVAQFPAGGAGLAHVLYTPDGKGLVTASYDNTIALLDASTGKATRTIGRASAGVLAMAISPDGRLLATTHNDGATRLWDLTRGAQVATLLSLNDGADWLAVTPDGLFDGSPRAWSTILWRFGGNTFDVAPVEAFFNEYYYPDLLSDVLAGKRPRAVADIAARDRRQAQLGIDVAGVAPGTESATRDAVVRVRIADAPAGARDLRVFRNGSLVKIWRGDALQGKPDAEFEVKVPLLAGANHFTAYVFNRDNIKSVDAVVDVTGAASLARRGVAHIVAVGINQYENADYNLRYATADAASFAADVKAQLEGLGRFERVEVTALSDRQATKAAIMKSLADLAARVQPEDEVLVFVASHGAAAGDRFYLIPSDLGYQGKRSELDEKAVETILAHSISDQEIEAAFESMNVNRLLFVIDACNSGQALEAEEKRRGPMNSKGLAQLAYEKGMYVLTASQSYQAAQEASELGHGLLTYALVTEGLDQNAADVEPADGRLVAREWLDYATGRVPRLQVEKIEEARKAGRQLRFSAGARGDMAGTDDNTQHPRVFYRRELDDAIWIVSGRR